MLKNIFMDKERISSTFRSSFGVDLVNFCIHHDIVLFVHVIVLSNLALV